MKLDDELAAIKARVEADVLTDDSMPMREVHAGVPTDISRLLAALELCRRQRDANYDGSLPDQAAERADAALLEILRGDR